MVMIMLNADGDGMDDGDFGQSENDKKTLVIMFVRRVSY